MAKYTFPNITDATFSEGYATVTVKAGIAEIDEGDPGEMLIAHNLKATKFVAPKKTVKTKEFKAGK